MLYVYYRYTPPAYFESSGHPTPSHSFREFATEAEVLRFYRQFLGNLHRDSTDIIFRIIEGREREIGEALVGIEFRVGD